LTVTWLRLILVLGVPGFAVFWLWSHLAHLVLPEWELWVLSATPVAYGVCSLLLVWVMREYGRQNIRLQVESIDACFETCYANMFMHTDADDLRHRWQMVRPKIDNMLRAVHSAAALPAIASWEIDRINECLNNDVWYLRRMAKSLRPPEPIPPNTADVAGGEPRPLVCNWSASATRGDSGAGGNAVPLDSPSGAAAAAAGSSGSEWNASHQAVNHDSKMTPVKNSEVNDNSGNRMLDQLSSISPSKRSMVLNTILEEEDHESGSLATRGAQAEVLMEQMRRLDREVAAARGRLTQTPVTRSVAFPVTTALAGDEAPPTPVTKPEHRAASTPQLPATMGPGTGDPETRGMVPTTSSAVFAPHAAPASTAMANAAIAPESLEPPAAAQATSSRDESKLSAVVGSKNERLRPSNKRRPAGSGGEQVRAAPKDANASPAKQQSATTPAEDNASPAKEQSAAPPADANASPAEQQSAETPADAPAPPAKQQQSGMTLAGLVDATSSVKKQQSATQAKDAPKSPTRHEQPAITPADATASPVKKQQSAAPVTCATTSSVKKQQSAAPVTDAAATPAKKQQSTASVPDAAATSVKTHESTAPVPDAVTSSDKKQQSTTLVPDAPTSAGSDDTSGGPIPVTIGCVCGYTCGTAKALDKHLANFANNPNHSSNYTFA